jgi:hypothetical protein
MSGSAPLTAANLARLNDLQYGVPFGKWGDLKSEVDDDSSIHSSQMQSDVSDSSSEASEASFNSGFDPDLVQEDYPDSLLDSLKSKARTLIRSTKLPSTWKKCTLLAGALIAGGIALGAIYNKFNSNKMFSLCAEEGFDLAAKDAFSILDLMNPYSKTPIDKYCKDALIEYKSQHFGG